MAEIEFYKSSVILCIDDMSKIEQDDDRLTKYIA